VGAVTTPYDRIAQSFIDDQQELQRFQRRAETYRQRRYYPFIQKALDEENRNRDLILEFERRGLTPTSGLPIGTPISQINDKLEEILKTRGAEEPIKAAQAARGGVWGLVGMPITATLGAVAPVSEQWQRKIVEPSAASWTGLVQKMIPGQQEIERKAQEFIQAGIPKQEAFTLAYQTSKLPTGAKGAIELGVDPFMWTAYPGLARGAVGAAKLGARGVGAAGGLARKGMAEALLKAPGMRLPRMGLRVAGVPEIGGAELPSDVLRVLTQAETRIAEIEKLLSKPGRLPKGMGTRKVAQQELGALKAVRFQGETLRSAESTEDVLQVARWKLQEASNELMARNAPYHGGIANKFPDMSSSELDRFCLDLDDFIRQVEGGVAAREVPAAMAPRTAVQPGMGLGEKIPQVEMMPEFQGKGVVPGLIRGEEVMARQEAVAAQRAGQRVLPEVPVAAKPTEAARLAAVRAEAARLGLEIRPLQGGWGVYEKDTLISFRRTLDDLEALTMTSGEVEKAAAALAREIKPVAELPTAPEVPLTLAKAPRAVARPAAAVTPITKKPWQMTRAAFLEEMAAPPGPIARGLRPPVSPTVGENIAFHRRLITEALAEGKPVPAEVLKDYPELAGVARPALLEAVPGAVPPVEAVPSAGIVPPSGAIPPVAEAAPSMPAGTSRAITLAEEKVRLAQPGIVSKAFDSFPLSRPLYRFFVPARGLTHNQHVAWVARSSAQGEYLTHAFSARNRALRVLDATFGPEFKTGAKAPLEYIGPAERAKSPLVRTAIDVLPNPDHYVLSQGQRDAIMQVAAYEDEFLNRAVQQYGVEIGRFPRKEGAAFIPNVDVSESALEVLGDAWTAAKVGRAKPRIWEDAIARQTHTPSFKPETNLETLFAASDEAKGNMVAQQVFKAKLGGLNRLEAMEKTHPALALKMSELKKRLQSLRGTLARLGVKQEAVIDDFLKSPLEDANLVELQAALDPTITRGKNLGKNAAVIRKEIQASKTQIAELRPAWKAANLKPYVFVQEGIFRYFPVKEAQSLRQLLEVSRNPLLSLAWEIRNFDFNLDLSPMTGIHLPLGFLSDPVGTTRQLVKGISGAVQRREWLRGLTQAGLADNIAKDPVSWGEFAAVTGRPIGATATEFAGGMLRRIPGYSKANDAMFTAVTYRSKAMFDDLARSLEKTGVPHNEAIVAASEVTHSAIPLIDHALLGQSQARAKLLQSVTISPSFLLRPPALLAEAAKALVKAGLKQPLTAKEKLSLRVVLTMGATIETISVSTAVINAQREGRDVAEAAIDALFDMAIHLPGGRKIPLGGPYRSLINALKPRWVNKTMDYMIPFAGVPRWAIGKLTPLLRTQYDLIRDKDFFNRKIMTGEFPVNILQAAAYQIEGAVPLTISAWIEGWRTGASLEETALESGTQLLGTSIYDRPGPWGLRTEWRDELRDYWAIPSTAIEQKAKGFPWSRTTYRKMHPEVDAKLFITGQVGSLQTDFAVREVFKLMQENNVQPDKIYAIRERKEKQSEAAAVGLRLASTPVDTLIQMLEAAPEGEKVPQPSGPVERWQAISARLDSSLLKALERVWYRSGKLTESEEARLQDIHQEFSLGQANFNTWLKQSLRQLYENSVWAQWR